MAGKRLIKCTCGHGRYAYVDASCPTHGATYQQPEAAFQGYWGNQLEGGCSNCARRDLPVLVLNYNNQQDRFCSDCTRALNDLLSNALEDL